MPKVPTIPCLIGSTRASFKSIPSLSPNNKIICNYETILNIDVTDDIAEDAYKGYLSWSQRPFNERGEILRAAAELVKKRKDLYVEAHMAIGAARPFAEIITQMAYQNILEHSFPVSRPDGEVLKSQMSQLAMTVKSPVGPVLSIAPWNAPTVLWARAISGPLAAGCSVVAKALEKAPITSFLFAEDFHKAGVDKNALQVAQFAPQDQPEATKRLIEHRRIKKVTFTGSSGLGARLAEIAGAALKPVLLELGGKNVLIITPEADLEKAAESLLFSAWLHNGQICMSLDNCYVHSSVYDDFLKVLVRKAQQQAAEATPLRDTEVSDKVRALVSNAIERGAKVAFGNSEQRSDACVLPLILTNVDKSMNIYSEETFGPVFSVIKYDRLEDVVDTVNDLRFGLKTSIWSKDVLGAIAVAKNIDTGAVHINSTTVHDEATVPHGGVGQSGFGRFNGKWGLDEFSFEKVITANP